jgi:hypothetical protein
MKVGHGLTSCTAKLEHTIIKDIPSHRQSLQGRRIIIVDTPGFDDTYVTDEEILRRIAVWLADS